MRATRYFSIGRDGCRVRERAKKREEWRELRLRLHASLQCPSILHWFSFSPFSYRPFFLFFHPLSIEPVAERSWTEQTLKRQIGSRTQFRIFTLLVVLFFLLISWQQRPRRCRPKRSSLQRKSSNQNVNLPVDSTNVHWSFHSTITPVINLLTILSFFWWPTKTGPIFFYSTLSFCHYNIKILYNLINRRLRLFLYNRIIRFNPVSRLVVATVNDRDRNSLAHRKAATHFRFFSFLSVIFVGCALFLCVSEFIRWADESDPAINMKMTVIARRYPDLRPVL